MLTNYVFSHFKRSKKQPLIIQCITVILEKNILSDFFLICDSVLKYLELKSLISYAKNF